MVSSQAGPSSGPTTCYFEGVEISFKGERPKTALKLVITAGKTRVSCDFKERDPLQWSIRFACPISEMLVLKLYAHRQGVSPFPKQLSLIETTMPDVQQSISLNGLGKIETTFTLHFSAHDRHPALPLTSIAVPSKRPGGPIDSEPQTKRAKEAVERAKAITKEQKVVLDVLGNARVFVDGIEAVLRVVGELHPAVKAASTALRLLYKAFEAQEACRDATKALVDELRDFLSIEKRLDELNQREDSRLAVEHMLDIITQMADYICEHTSNNRLYGQLFAIKHRKKIEEFKKEFVRAKESFDRGIDLEILHVVHKTEQELHLQRLHPAENAHYHSGDEHICLPGTRKHLLRRLMRWVTGSPEAYLQSFWLYGVAGSGKSSTANTIALLVEEETGLDLTCYFCKRDDEHLSKPENLLPTLAYRIAQYYTSYRTALVDLVCSREGAGLPTADITKQFRLLFEELLPRTTVPLRSHVIVIDALDECGSSADQEKLAACILSLARLAPWFKVFVTSRPEPKILDIFSAPESDCIVANINEEADTDLDIRTFIGNRLKHFSLSLPEEQVNELVRRAAGLFIWCSTLFKYVERSRNRRRDIHLFLSGERAQAPLTQLYALYDLILQSAVDMGHQDDMLVLHALLGAIYVSAGNRPLSASALSSFLRVDKRFEYEDSNSVQSLIRALHAVVYEDSGVHGAIRVLHPSFLDFIQQKLEDGFRINIDKTHRLMFNGCFFTMHQELKFNICRLEDSYRLNKDVPNLHGLVTTYISEALQYSSLFWSTHLLKSGLLGADESAKAPVSELLTSIKALFWLEVLSLINATGQGIAILQECAVFFTDSADISNAAADLERFVVAYGEAFRSTPHIYLSALAWLPENAQTQSLARSFAHLPMITRKQVAWERARWARNVGSHVYGVAYSSDGNLVAAGLGDGTIRIWNARTFEEAYEPLEGHLSNVFCVAFSPDNQFIASGSGDMSTRLWNVQTGENLKTFENHKDVWSVAFSPNDKILASASSDGMARVWDLRSGEMTAVFKGCSVSFSASGERVISGCEDGTVRIWDACTGEAIGSPLEGHRETVYSVACSRDGRFIASGSYDGTMRIWDAQTGAPVREPIEYGSSVNSVAFSADTTRTVSGCEDDSIRVWSVATERQVCEPLEGHTAEVNSVSLSPDGRSVLSGSEDKTIRMWDIDTAATADEPLPGHFDEVKCVAFSPNGELIASASEDKTVRLWNAFTGVAVGEPLQGHSDSVSSVAFAPNSEWVVSSSLDELVIIWEVRTGAMLGEPLRGHTGCVFSVAVSSDGRSIASGSSDKTVRIWDKKTRAVLMTLVGHTDSVYSVAFLPDAQHVISGSEDMTIRVWNIQTGETVLGPLTDHAKSITSVAVSPDGRYFASDSKDRTARIWDASTGEVIHVLKGHRGDVNSVAFSPDSRYVISGSDDTTIRVWNVGTGESACDPLKGHSMDVYSVSFSPDGQQIASGSQDSTIRMWDARFAGDEPSTGELHRTRWNACCRRMDPTDGWVKNDEKLLLWVPQCYRENLRWNPTLCFTIGDTDFTPEVDLIKLRAYAGERWTDIYQC